jgi:hypothetical protein
MMMSSKSGEWRGGENHFPTLVRLFSLLVSYLVGNAHIFGSTWALI